jgi:hypothetical protein
MRYPPRIVTANRTIQPDFSHEGGANEASGRKLLWRIWLFAQAVGLVHQTAEVTGGLEREIALWRALAADLSFRVNLTRQTRKSLKDRQKQLRKDLNSTRVLRRDSQTRSLSCGPPHWPQSFAPHRGDPCLLAAQLAT